MRGDLEFEAGKVYRVWYGSGDTDKREPDPSDAVLSVYVTKLNPDTSSPFPVSEGMTFDLNRTAIDDGIDDAEIVFLEDHEILEELHDYCICTGIKYAIILL